MMDIVMLVAGAGVGAMLRDLFVLHRGGVAKTRQQLESKTPYDYALTNAINERDRLQGELVTIQALKRTESDTERIRNEIGTILSDGGEEAPESVYEPNIGMPIQDNGDGTFSPITWDNRISSGEMANNISKAVARVTMERERSSAAIISGYGMNTEEAARAYSRNSHDNKDIGDIVDEINEIRFKDSGGVSAVETKDGVLTDSPWEAQITLEEWARNVSKAFSTYGTNVREDDAEDEHLTEYDVERSLINDIKDKASENLELAVEFAKMAEQDDDAIRKRLEETSKELSKEIGERRRRMREFREEGKYYGETLYRKGNR